ncbi:MAG: hypothetical protein H6719_25875 [Sandaracinaceae bacterium]|nr:hypothetical protein [Sandaracinaceae bacterium]
MLRLALALTLLTACAEEPPAPAPAPEAVPPAEPSPIEAREPPPPSELPLPEARTLRIEARDGLELVGDLRRSSVEGAALVVLVHQLSTTRAEWEPLLRRLGAAPALTTFALDMRGHGESTQRRGHEVRWADFETRDWELVAQDLGVVLAHLRDVEHIAPSRDPRRLEHRSKSAK